LKSSRLWKPRTVERETKICQQSFVHVEQMHLAGLKMRLTPLNWDGKIEVCPALDGRVLNLGVERYQDLNHVHLDLVESRHVDEKTMILKMRTNGSLMDIAMGVRIDLFIKKK
jgi:alpha,alpha-trehalase